MEALARHRKRKAKKVLALLDKQYGDEDPALMQWLWPHVADLAVEMRLEEAVPLLMDSWQMKPTPLWRNSQEGPCNGSAVTWW